MNTEWLDDLNEVFPRLATRQMRLPDGSKQAFAKVRALLAATPPPTAPGAYLLMLALSEEPRWLTLCDGFGIGRHRDNALQLPSGWASNFHCRIVIDAPDWVLEDLGSTNGTRVNGSPVKRHPLRYGETISLGDVRLIFVCIDDTAVATPSLDTTT